LGDLDSAEVAYRRAILYAPELPDPYLQLGHLLKELGRTQDAETAYLWAFTRRKSSPDAMRELASLGWPEAKLLASSQPPAAHSSSVIVPNSDKSSFQAALSAFKRKRPSIISRADLARDHGHWPLATRLYRKALRRQPGNAPIWIQYGHALKELENFDQAKVAYLTSLAYDPQAADSWIQLGHLYKIQSKNLEAQFAYLRAFALNPSVPQITKELVAFGWSDAEITELRCLIEFNSNSVKRSNSDALGLLEQSTTPSVSDLNTDEQEALLTKLGYFCSEFYLMMNPDVAASGCDPYRHYLDQGFRENRNPNSWFQTNFYFDANPDVSRDVCPLLHYATAGGVRSGRRCNPYLIDNFKLPFDLRKRFAPIQLPVSSWPGPDEVAVKLAVHIHCFYVECLPLIISHLRNIPIKFDLFVSVSSSIKEIVAEELGRSGLNPYRLVVCPDRGRDIAPMIVSFSQDLQGYDLALHLHTKKSIEHGSFGSEWMDDILRKLLFNQAYTARIIQMFTNDERLGAVGPVPHWRIRPFMQWGRNKQIVIELMTRFGLSNGHVGDDCPEFPAGSMFWFRPRALAPILDAGLKFDDFPEEPIPDDGTIAHSIERCFFCVPEQTNFTWRIVEPLPYERCWPTEIKPMVSIVIPMHNALPWIYAAIQSALAQDAAGSPFEIVIVENNSTDGGREEISKFARLYNNIVFVVEDRRGAGAARNKGISKARGEYITFLDADDVLATDALQKMVALISMESALDFVTSSLVLFDEHGWYSSPEPHRQPQDPKTEYIVVERERYEERLSEFRRIFDDFGPCAKLYRTAFLRDNGISFPEAHNFEDNVFVARVYMTARRIGVIPKPLYFYRKYQDLEGATQSTSREMADFMDQLTAVRTVIREWGPENAKDQAFRLLLLRAYVEKIGRELVRFGSLADSLAQLAAEDEIIGAISKHGLGELCLPEHWESIVSLRSRNALEPTVAVAVE